MTTDQAVQVDGLLKRCKLKAWEFFDGPNSGGSQKIRLVKLLWDTVREELERPRPAPAQVDGFDVGELRRIADNMLYESQDLERATLRAAADHIEAQGQELTTTRNTLEVAGHEVDSLRRELESAHIGIKVTEGISRQLRADLAAAHTETRGAKESLRKAQTDWHAVFDKLKADLAAAREEAATARRTAAYWKDEKIAADAEIDSVSDAMPKGSEFLDPPDGGDVPLAEQVRRLAAAFAQERERNALAERRGVERAFRYSLSHLPCSIFEATVKAAVECFMAKEEDDVEFAAARASRAQQGG